VIVVDTSAWVEFLRKTGSAVNLLLRQLIEEGAELAVTEVVVMKVSAGARSQEQAAELRGQLLAFPLLTLGGLEGFDAAAELYRACRAEGESVRELSDCLVAAPTIAAGATLLQADRDFEILARHTELVLEPVTA
jgi:predicted nucleic acid-binding protein